MVPGWDRASIDEIGGLSFAILRVSQEKPMADKSSFTKEEWTSLLESPMMAGMAVTAADPSGIWGLLKESFAGGGALAEVTTDSMANALVKAVAADFATTEGRSAARDGLKEKF